MVKKYRGFLLTLVSAIFLINTVAFAAPTSVTAQSAILVEKDSGRVLYEKNPTQKMYPASMTKIMTALVALDYFEPDALVTVGDEINSVSLDSSKAGHTRGETLTVENLIRGLIIPSGNDTATVLAASVAKKVENNTDLTYDESEKIFARLMNEKAKELGATNTNFSNPHGYHAEDHYTTAEDMAKITSVAMDNPTIAAIGKEKRYSGNGAGANLESDTTIKSNEYTWKSHNLLITEGDYFYEYATGLKTGFTNEAGDCVAATAEKDGVQLIAVVFNSEDPNRWLDAKALFEFGFNDYKKITYTSAEPVETVKLEGHNRLLGDTIDILIKEDVNLYLSITEESKITKTITYKPELLGKGDETEDVYLKAPIGMGDEVGKIEYILDGKVMAERTLYSASAVEESTFMSSVKYFFKNLGENLFTLKGLIIAVAVIVIIIIIIIIFKIIRNRRNRGRYKYKLPKY